MLGNCMKDLKTFVNFLYKKGMIQKNLGLHN